MKKKSFCLPFFRLLFIGFLNLLTCTNLAYAQSDWEQYFYDGFDSGNTNNWSIVSDSETDVTVVQIAENYVLHGSGQFTASLLYPESWWADYNFKSRIRIAQGSVQFWYRNSGVELYFVSFSNDEIGLHKYNISTDDHEILMSVSGVFDPSSWHEIEIIGLGSQIRIFVNGEERIDFVDPDPILSGSIMLFSQGNSDIYVDYIEVIGQPLPESHPDYTWTRTGGPIGGTGYDVRIHPENRNMLFVTDNPSGVNKSMDGGMTWKQKNTGIEADPDRFGNGAPIFCLTIDPTNPNIIWSGTQDFKGIYKSTDYGESWFKMDKGITEGDDISFRGFAVHPTNSDIVLAAAEIQTGHYRNYYIPTRGKIYKTIDGGENWYPVWEGTNLARVLIYNYDDPSIMYCSTGIFDREADNMDWDNKLPGGEGVLKSIDGGETWFNINNGIENPYVGFLEMHPTNPNILYAASGSPVLEQHMEIEGAVSITTNGGDSWESVLDGAAYFSVVSPNPQNPNILYTGNSGAFYRSDDGGQTWQEPYLGSGVYGPPGISAGVPIGIAIQPDDPNTLYINSYQGGNFNSTDGGKTWVNRSNGYTGAEVRDVQIDPQNPGIIYCAAITGLSRSINGGTDWEGIAYGPASGVTVWHEIAVNPSNYKEVFASDEHNGRILKSEDGGFNWKTVFQHPSIDVSDNDKTHGFKAIVYAPSDHATIYAGMRKRSNNEYYGPSHGIYKSTDSGENWIEKNGGLDDYSRAINSIAVHPDNPDTVYIGTVHNGVFKTVDGGNNWIRKSDGLGFSDVYSLAINPENPDILYAGSGDGKGLWISNDAGESWHDSNNGITVECPSYLSPIGGVVMGNDLEDPKPSFSNYNFVPWTKIVDIEIDPSDCNNVYVADLNTGIYATQDGGDNWWQINDGLSIIPTYCLTISDDGEILYSGTFGGGVHRLVLGSNRAPSIVASIPGNIDTTTVFLGDSLLFEAIAFDLNNDTLKYRWFMDEQLIPDSDSSKYIFNTENLFLGDYELRAEIADNDTSVYIIWNVRVVEQIHVGNALDGVSSTFSLKQNFPNPFDQITTISYQLRKSSHVCLKVYNLLGQEIVCLVDGNRQAGQYSVAWDGRNGNKSQVSNGIYIYRIEFRDGQNFYVQERKMILLK